jgi:hypothetical protein
VSSGRPAAGSGSETFRAARLIKRYFGEIFPPGQSDGPAVGSRLCPPGLIEQLTGRELGVLGTLAPVSEPVAPSCQSPAAEDST